MGKLKCGCVTADARNTPDVRNGYELGGYTKSFCDYHKAKIMAKKPSFRKPTPEEAKIMAGIAQNTTGKSSPAIRLLCAQCKHEWAVTSLDVKPVCPKCKAEAPGNPHVQSANSIPRPFDTDGEAKPHTHEIRRTLPRYVYHVSGHAKLHASVPRSKAAGADSRQVPQAVPFEVVARRPSPITRDEDMEALRRDVRNHVQDELKKADSPYLVGDTMIRGLSFLHLIYVDHDNENGEPARVVE